MRYKTLFLHIFPICLAACATTVPSVQNPAKNNPNTNPADTNAAAPSVPPRNLLADPGSNQVTLTWQSDATFPAGVSYWVQRRGTVGSFVDLAEVDSLTFTDTQAVNGQLYYYVVLATVGDMRGPATQPVAARPLAMFTGWTEDRYYPTLRRSAYSAGMSRFASVGDRGRIETAIVADSFAPISHSPISDDLTDVAAGPTAFVAVGPGGVLLNSLDGNTFVSVRTADQTSTPSAVVYDGTRFVVANGCRISTSTDASNWQDVGSCSDGIARPQATRLVLFGTTYVALDSAGLWESNDLSHWAPLAKATGLEDLTVRGNDILAVGCKTAIMVNNSTTTPLAQTQCWHGVGNDGTTFIVGGDGGEIARSSDGLTWSDEDININVTTPTPTRTGTATLQDPDRRTFYDLSVLGDDVLAVGEGDTILHRGITEPAWDNVQLGYGSAIEAIAQSPALLVAVGPEWQEGTLLSSGDGLGWLRTATVNPLHAVVYANSLFVIAGDKGFIATTSDGHSIDIKTSGTTQNFRGLAQGLITVAVGDGGLVASAATSDANFIVHGSGVTDDLRDVAFGNSTYVAVGKAGVVIVSTDAVNWRAAQSVTSQDFLSLTFVNNEFVAVTADGSLYTSPNGTNWSRNVVAPGIVAATEYANLWYAWGGSDLYVSSDLQVWSHKKETVWRGAQALTLFNGRWLELGSGEQIEAQASAPSGQ